MGVWQVTVVGISMVFLIFVILYFLFILMGYITKLTSRKAPAPTVVEVEETAGGDEEEVAAIFAAVYTMLGKAVKIKKIARGDREWVVWRKEGWRGVRGWRRSSR